MWHEQLSSADLMEECAPSPAPPRGPPRPAANPTDEFAECRGDRVGRGTGVLSREGVDKAPSANGDPGETREGDGSGEARLSEARRDRGVALSVDMRRSRSRASFRCCVISMRSVPPV